MAARHTVGRALGAAALAAGGAAALWGAGALARRWHQRARGVGTIAVPPLPSAPEPPHSGFSATVEVKSLLAPGDGRIATQIPWNDQWFFEDPAVFNDQLAQALAALAFVAVSESYHFKHQGKRPADMEATLAALGFSDCQTHSYQYRSRPVDEVLDALAGDVDVVAYALGAKELPVPEGARPCTLILVAVRGSYGSEWFSNINLPPEPGAETPQTLLPPEGAAGAARVAGPQVAGAGTAGPQVAGAGTAGPQASGAGAVGPQAPQTPLLDAQTRADLATTEGLHHRGFQKAAKEILADLVDYTCGLGDRDVKLVLCGHSRGGSVANYVAAQVVRLEHTPFAVTSRNNLYCYTVAAPTVTSAVDAQGPAFSGIFNICNPCDPVPRIPLWRWGYRRFGVDVELPGEGDPGFPALFQRFSDRFEQQVHAPVPYDPQDRSAVNRLTDMLARHIPSRKRWARPSAKLFFGLALLSQSNPVRLFGSHYESVYLTWLQTAAKEDLRFLPAGQPLR